MRKPRDWIHSCVPLRSALIMRKHGDSGPLLWLVFQGGWTTTVYSALDRRITASIPIAGSLPLGIPDATRDYEQFLPGLYLDYLDLYLMASSDGHRQTQILNSHDVCCFKGVYSDLYREFAVEASRSLGGRFEVIVANRSEHSVPMREFLGTIQSLAESNSSLSHQ